MGLDADFPFKDRWSFQTEAGRLGLQKSLMNGIHVAERACICEVRMVAVEVL